MGKKPAKRLSPRSIKRTIASAGPPATAAAVLTADLGSVIGLAKFIAIPGSYISLFSFAVLAFLSMYMVFHYLNQSLRR